MFCMDGMQNNLPVSLATLALRSTRLSTSEASTPLAARTDIVERYNIDMHEYKNVHKICTKYK